MKLLPILAFTLIGCASHPTRTAPLTAGARASVSAAQDAATQAQAASRRASAQIAATKSEIAATKSEIAAAKSDLQRIESKDELIREWEARQIIKHHPPMTNP